MPSNQEIAGWLREAAEMSDRLQLAYSELYPGGGGDTRLYDVFNARAVLVEQRSCETCMFWNCIVDTEFNILLRPFVECRKIPIKGEGPQFSCPHWEAKQ